MPAGSMDDVMMRFSEMVQSFPPLILAMVIAAAMGPSVINSVFAMAIIWWPNYARLTRSIVHFHQRKRLCDGQPGCWAASRLRILFREILPNSIGPLVVMSTLDLGNAILMFSGLSFLGLGVQPPDARMGRHGQRRGGNTFQNWWISTFPGPCDLHRGHGRELYRRRLAGLSRSAPAQPDDIVISSKWNALPTD